MSEGRGLQKLRGRFSNIRKIVAIDLTLNNLYDRLFLILLAIDIVLRIAWLGNPNVLIFDEPFYVGAAGVILGYRNYLAGVLGVHAGLDPVPFHPPLAKLIIALSMYLLGDNGFGWRIPSVIFGSVSILAFYLLLKKVANGEVALIGAFLFSFDILVFDFSRIAMLDIFTLAFILLGSYWYFSGRPLLSALGMALGTLTKMTGLVGFLVIGSFHLVNFLAGKSEPRSWKSLLAWLGKYVAVYAFSFLAILTVLDRIWVGYANAFVHLYYMFRGTSSAALMSACPKGIVSCPWQWLLNQVPISTVVMVPGNSTSAPTYTFRIIFAMNPAIMLLAIPAMAYSGYSYLRRKDVLPLLNLVWFAFTYLPYSAVIFWGRSTFIYYFLLTMPSVCAAIAYLIINLHVPRPLILIYLGAVLLVFLSAFPFIAKP
jgi:dolichyl-phosphate-mannose-protein mannosyltransferase